LEGFFSQLGGILGLCFGASLVSMCHLLYTVIQWAIGGIYLPKSP